MATRQRSNKVPVYAAHQPEPTKPLRVWHGGTMVAWIALGIAVIGNVLSLGYTYGAVSVRLTHVETATLELRAETKAMSALREDIAVAKTHLTNINSTLERLERSLTNSRQR